VVRDALRRPGQHGGRTGVRIEQLGVVEQGQDCFADQVVETPAGPGARQQPGADRDGQRLGHSGG
jgi:hypothetical protein